MPGKRYLLDTNALVALLQGDDVLLGMTEQAEWLGVSIINILEFMGFHGLTESDRGLLLELASRIHVVDLKHDDHALMEVIIGLRQRRSVKLPDAIIMASAVMHRATILTRDLQLLKVAQTDPAYSAQDF
ncbi:MAG: PIN domain-containing protein [Pseudomonadota bacterium]